MFGLGALNDMYALVSRLLRLESCSSDDFDSIPLAKTPNATSKEESRLQERFDHVTSLSPSSLDPGRFQAAVLETIQSCLRPKSPGNTT